MAWEESGPYLCQGTAPAFSNDALGIGQSLCSDFRITVRSRADKMFCVIMIQGE
jgi:hypothetical protein